MDNGLIDSFILRALLAGGAVVTVTGLLGVFLLWRRMAYFGDALSHSALLGVALGIALGGLEYWLVLAVCVAVAFLMTWIQRKPELSNDTILGILGHGGLALGLIALHFSTQSGGRSLEAYLFGDILLLQNTDVYFALGLSALVIGVVWYYWQALLLMTAHPELAQAEGINTERLSLIYMLLIALVIAIAMRVVGIFLLTSLLIIPAATARRLARTPEQMVLIAVFSGLIALILGLLSSLWLDSPAGPSIVVISVMGFALVQALPQR
ncbi:MAG: metal ABC transporter permease [Thiofilum sp.]|uniref:metal ABC transporter permease n=1 Tax=Thiofilum sp. TaxID=2212733 RepID=UPI0025EEB1AD|nr:metal ABC transporter permease [Thiofilum sp.]MBK8452083.1 metal ABC transporter permease [Thiofilum sp.]